MMKKMKMKMMKNMVCSHAVMQLWQHVSVITPCRKRYVAERQQKYIVSFIVKSITKVNLDA